jgi:hypothetical protein
MLGINLSRILSREDWDETDAQYHTINHQWQSHFFSCGLGFVEKAPNATPAVLLISIGFSA